MVLVPSSSLVAVILPFVLPSEFSVVNITFVSKQPGNQDREIVLRSRSVFHMELSREEVEQLKGAASILTQIEQRCSSAGSGSGSCVQVGL